MLLLRSREPCRWRSLLLRCLWQWLHRLRCLVRRSTTLLREADVKEEVGLDASDALCFRGILQMDTLRLMDSPVEDGGTLTLNDCT